MNALWPDVWSRQRFLVAEVLAHVDFLDESIERLSAEIAERERTFEVVLDRYGTVRPDMPMRWSR